MTKQFEQCTALSRRNGLAKKKKIDGVVGQVKNLVEDFGGFLEITRTNIHGAATELTMRLSQDLPCVANIRGINRLPAQEMTRHLYRLVLSHLGLGQ